MSPAQRAVIKLSNVDRSEVVKRLRYIALHDGTLVVSKLDPKARNYNRGIADRPRGRGSLVVKVTDSWLVCYGFQPSTAKDPPCRGGRCTLNVSRLKRTTIGVVSE
ncbi:hypothetical protein TNCV_2078411 [Trichonephila clavipes]|nr:hypothetical protein TNCV_2078411 [Trichonephila clavipes]